MTNLSPYAAPCVRACALRSTLLRPEEWRTLSALGSSAAAITWLQQRGVFSGNIPNVFAAERAAHEAVIHDSTALLRFARGDVAELLRFFVWHYDLLNLESLIYRIHAMPESDQGLEQLYPTGSVGALRKGLSGVTNYATLARVLKGSVFAAPFAEALLRYHDDEDVAQFVERIELGFFTLWVQAAKRCGFQLAPNVDGSALAVFLVGRVIETVVRLKRYRAAESSRIVGWLSIVAKGAKIEACLEALDSDSDAAAVQALVEILLPLTMQKRLLSKAQQSARPEALLRRLVWLSASKANRGIVFNVDFLTSFLTLRVHQARELTMILEAKDAGVDSEALLCVENAA